MARYALEDRKTNPLHTLILWMTQAYLAQALNTHALNTLLSSAQFD